MTRWWLYACCTCKNKRHGHFSFTQLREWALGWITTQWRTILCITHLLCNQRKTAVSCYSSCRFKESRHKLNTGLCAVKHLKKIRNIAKSSHRTMLDGVYKSSHKLPCNLWPVAFTFMLLTLKCAKEFYFGLHWWNAGKCVKKMSETLHL